MHIRDLLQKAVALLKTHYRLTITVVLLVVLAGYALTRYSIRTDEVIYLAVAGPMGTADGKAMVRGINLALEETNQKGGIRGKEILLRGFDDRHDPELARQKAHEIANDAEIPLVLGHYYSTTSLAAGSIYRNAGIPAITPSALANEVTKDNPWYFRTTFSNEAQAAFLANYARYILNHEMAYIIYSRDAYGRSLREDFAEYFVALGGKIGSVWSYDPESADLTVKLQAIVKSLASLSKGQSPGIIFLATRETESETIVVALKRLGVNLPVLGDDWTLDQKLATYPEERKHPGYFSDGIYVVVPLLFDVSNTRAKRFQEEFQRTYKETPRVTSAMYYEAALVAIEALKRAEGSGDAGTVQEVRQHVREALSSLNSREQAVQGISGLIYFTHNGDLTGDRTLRMGVFRNQQLTSALTQLTPVENLSEIGDLNMALEENRVLLLNNRYMYKTSLVHTGMEINNIGNPDPKDFSYDMDFYLWFRYQGEFDDHNIVFVNSVTPLQLRRGSKPEGDGGILAEMSEYNGLIYRRYHVKGRFKADFLPGLRGFKQQHVLGVSFYHQRLHQHNLVYIVDTVGMGLTNERSLLKKIQEEQILSAGSGWTVNQARHFEDRATTRSLGDPRYLPRQGNSYIYSRFNTGIWIKRTEYVGRKIIAILQDGIPLSATPFLVIGSGAALIVLHVIRRRKAYKRRLLRFLQLLLLFIFFLVGEGFFVTWLGNVILPSFGATAYTYYLSVTTLAFEILWFVLPALFCILALPLFVWEFIEEYTGYVVPKIIRHAVVYVICLLTFFGIIAFVFGQDITSLAATSGALALLIGFANRVDISNIFAGIGISVTKPFRIGDWVQVNDLEEGRVIDMTSRVTKIETRDRTMLSIPNTMVAGGVLENFNYPDKYYRIKIELQTAPVYKFERAEKVLLDAAFSTEGVLKDPAPYVVFHGQGDSAARFAVHCFVDDYGKRVQYTQDIWRRIWRHLEIAGIELATPRREILIVQTPTEDLTAPLTILRKLSLFQMLSDNDRLALSERVRPHQVAQGETIFRQGDSGTSLFLVVEGAVGLWLRFKDGKAIEVIRVGVADCFGEIELLNKEARHATAIAATDTTLFEFSAEILMPLLEQYTDLTERLEQIMSIREKRIEEQIDLFQLEDIDQHAPSKRLLHKTQKILSGKKT